jgi:hypothetical protein
MGTFSIIIVVMLFAGLLVSPLEGAFSDDIVGTMLAVVEPFGTCNPVEDVGSSSLLLLLLLVLLL